MVELLPNRTAIPVDQSVGENAAVEVDRGRPIDILGNVPLVTLCVFVEAAHVGRLHRVVALEEGFEFALDPMLCFHGSWNLRGIWGCGSLGERLKANACLFLSRSPEVVNGLPTRSTRVVQRNSWRNGDLDGGIKQRLHLPARRVSTGNCELPPHLRVDPRKPPPRKGAREPGATRPGRGRYVSALRARFRAARTIRCD